MYPRFPAFVQAAGFLGSAGFPNIYNITVLYYKISEAGKKDFSTCPTPRIIDFIYGTFSKSPWHIAVNVEKLSLLSLGMSRRNLEKWLEKTWIEKDGIISQYMIAEEEEEEEKLKKIAKEHRKLFHRKRRQTLPPNSTR